MKRVFDTQGQFFRDVYEDEVERRGVLVFSAAPADAYLSAGTRVPDSRPLEDLDVLLAQAKAQRASAANSLLAYLDDERVRPALVSLCRQIQRQQLADVAQALGYSGGPGAVAVLKTRLRELAQTDSPFAAGGFFSAEAGSLLAVAIALLKLSPEDESPLEVLLRLLRHPTRLNRIGALRATSQLLIPQRRIRTGPYRRLRQELFELCESEELEGPLSCAPLLLDEPLRRTATIDRIRSVLVRSSLDLRQVAVDALLFFSPAQDTLTVVLEHLQVETSLRLRIHIARHVGRLMDQVQCVDVVRSGLGAEAPSIRLDTLPVLYFVKDREQRIVLAENALGQEPDVFLQQLLRAFAVGERAAT